MRVIDCGRLLLLAALWGASFLFMRITTPAFGAVNSAFIGLANVLAPWP